MDEVAALAVPKLMYLNAPAIRHACIALLDVPLPHAFAPLLGSQLQIRLPTAALHHHYERRRLAMAIREFVLYETSALEMDLPNQSSEKAVAFWHQQGFPLGVDPGSQMVSLPDAVVIGLETAVRVGGMQVFLYYCQRVRNAPQGVVLCSAEDVLPWARARAFLERGNHVALLVDAVRATAIKGLPGFTWLIDRDTVWLRSASVVVAELPALAGGHFFGSASGRPSAPGVTSQRFEALHAVFYWARPRDCLVSQPPTVS